MEFACPSPPCYFHTRRSCWCCVNTTTTITLPCPAPKFQHGCKNGGEALFNTVMGSSRGSHRGTSSHVSNGALPPGPAAPTQLTPSCLTRGLVLAGCLAKPPAHGVAEWSPCWTLCLAAIRHMQSCMWTMQVKKGATRAVSVQRGATHILCDTTYRL